MRSIQGGKRGTYSRARTSYVEDRRGEGSISTGQSGLVAGVAPLFHLGVTQGYGVIQHEQLRVRFSPVSGYHRPEDEVRHSDLVLGRAVSSHKLGRSSLGSTLREHEDADRVRLLPL